MNNDKQNKTKFYWDSLAGKSHAAAAIDPADNLGFKNAYIERCRNTAFASRLKDLASGVRVLDYGCGTGTFLSWLTEWRKDICGYGIDFSKEMLRLALELHPGLAGKLSACDGQSISFKDRSFDAICTTATLIYVLEDCELLSLAKEFHRLLVPGGIVASDEQIRFKRVYQPEHHKVQRTPEEIINIFSIAGFELIEWRQIRRGRFPLIYLIRYGLIPSKWHDFIVRMEARLWRTRRPPQADYADAFFMWRVKD